MVTEDTIRTLLARTDEDYYGLLAELMPFRIEGEYQLMAKPKDCGEKSDYYQEYIYDSAAVKSKINQLIVTGKWFKSIYLSWVLYEMRVKQENLLLCFDSFLQIVQNNSYGRLLERNRFECYGFAKIAFAILDKIFVTKCQKQCNIFFFLKLALEGACSYTYYHKGENSLWDTEIFSSYARMFDIYRGEMTIILLEMRLGSYVPYSYVFGMHQASILAPVETNDNYDYLMNAQMMAQHQSVVGLTGDAMDATYDEVLEFAEHQYQQLCSYVIQNSIIDGEHKYNVRNFITEVNNIYLCSLLSDSNLANIRYFSQYYQLEIYNKVGYKHKPYKRTSINYKQLLRNWGIEDSCSPYTDGNGILSLEIRHPNVMPMYYTEHPSYDTDGACIYFIYATLQPNEDLESLMIYGHKLHAQCLDVQRSGLFWGIPCLTTYTEYGSSMDKLILYVGTNYDKKKDYNKIYSYE